MVLEGHLFFRLHVGLVTGNYISEVHESRTIVSCSGIDARAPLSAAGYSGLCLPFRGITEYLYGLLSVYEHPIIAGVRVLIIYSTYWG